MLYNGKPAVVIGTLRGKPWQYEQDVVNRVQVLKPEYVADQVALYDLNEEKARRT